MIDAVHGCPRESLLDVTVTGGTSCSGMNPSACRTAILYRAYAFESSASTSGASCRLYPSELTVSGNFFVKHSVSNGTVSNSVANPFTKIDDIYILHIQFIFLHSHWKGHFFVLNGLFSGSCYYFAYNYLPTAFL